MGAVFLYSNLTPAFRATSAPFVAAAGGRAARIAWAVASATGWERFLPRYWEPWRELGAREVVPIVPTGDPARLSADALRGLATCSGIFVCGGDTRAYHALYVQGPAGDIIRARCAEGVAYAGLSAGALIAAQWCTVWGDRLTTSANACYLGGADAGCDAELQVSGGLGLIAGVVPEPHFSERGGFPRLVAAMAATKTTCGLGFDDGICVHGVAAGWLSVEGHGRAYMFTSSGPGTFACRVLEPGDRMRLGPVDCP